MFSFLISVLCLQVLHSQTMRLCQERLGDLIRVEEYATGRSLTVSYWKEMALRDLKSDLGYRLTVHVSYFFIFMA